MKKIHNLIIFELIGRTMKAGIIMLLIGCISLAWEGVRQQNFDRSEYYESIASGNLESINAQLDIVKKSSFKDHEAFEGALLMRKAGLARKPKEKLDLFKTGRNKLESSITKDTSKAELRFLRLLIQENAPKMLKYSNEIGKDSQYIREKFKSLIPEVQEAIINYSKNSKILKPAYF